MIWIHARKKKAVTKVTKAKKETGKNRAELIKQMNFDSDRETKLVGTEVQLYSTHINLPGMPQHISGYFTNR
jgi:hypothetical protein